jgi:sulfur carrier protein
MNLKINGKDYFTESETITVTELLEDKKVSTPDMVSVQLNGGFVKRNNFSATVLNNNDQVDFLYFMGGGSF